MHSYRMRYFGTPVGRFTEDATRVETPVGQACLNCAETVVEGDTGIITHLAELGPLRSREAPQHLECFLRRVVGSVGHQLGKCSCFGGAYEDPPDMTPREAARAAVALYQTQGRRA